jgi:hypothetical protein
LNSDTHDYDINWSAINASGTAPATKIQSAFQYTHALKIWSFPVNGPYNSYLGGGYVYKMTGNLTETASDFQLLRQNDWIDRNTRGLFVELSIYNPNIAMFAYCYLLFEIMPTGSIMTSYRFSTVKLLEITNLVSMGSICALVYILMILALTFRQIYLILIYKISFFKRIWSYFDISLIVCSFIAFSIWLARLWEVQRVLTQISNRSSNHSYINLQMLAYLDDFLSCTLGICVCVATLKFLKILQFNSTIRTLFRTISICVSELASFSVIFSIAVFAFIQAGYVVFNDRIKGLSTIFKSIETGFLLMLGKFQLQDMMIANPICSVIFYLSFNALVIMILLHIFISVICDAFEVAKKEELTSDPLFLEAYFYNKINQYLREFGKKVKRTLLCQRKILSEEELTKASLAHTGKYIEQTNRFDFKANILVTILQSVIYFNFYKILVFIINEVNNLKKKYMSSEPRFTQSQKKKRAA